MGVRQQRGFNLVELMVAVLIGSILILGALKVFSSNTQAMRLQQLISGAQENGRLAMEMMKADLRRAGMGAPVGADEIVGVNDAVAVATIPGLLRASDSIQVAYQPAETTTDCEGNAAPVGPQVSSTVINRYYVAQDTNPNIPALFCDGRVTVISTASGAAVTTTTDGPSGTALLRGVESFQVQYGVLEPAPTGTTPSSFNGYGSARRYVTAGQMGGAVQQQVVSIRIGLLVRSEAGIDNMPAPANAIPLLDTTLSVDDLAAVRVGSQRPIHRAFVETVALRNSATSRL